MKALKSFTLDHIYQKLYEAFGPQKWWPGETRIEIIVGAVLTQNTNWGNVEKAIANLKREKVLNIKSLYEIPEKKLAKLIRPAGYFNVKARRLKNVIVFLVKQYEGQLNRLNRKDTRVLRKELLGINGVGPETADSILLYAFHRPVFVVDAYTKRMLCRHHLLEEDVKYDDVQKIFHRKLKADEKIFNEYHALIVNLGKKYCRPKPVCDQCPLNEEE